MYGGSTMNDNNQEQLQTEENDDSHQVDFIDVLPSARNPDGFYATKCDSGDWFGEVRQENLPVVNQESDDVCCVICLIVSYTAVNMITYLSTGME